MKIWYIRNYIFILTLFLLPLSPSYADSVPLFGPETYTRTTGTPDRFERGYRLPPRVDAPFNIKVTNGTSSGTNRISSSSLFLNGVEVVKERDFNQQVAITKTYHLKARK